MSGSVSMVDGHVDPDKNRPTDKEIIKALECCDGSFDKCGECPLDSVNQDKLRCWELEKSALDLINRLQAKVIKEQNKNSKLWNERNSLQAEVERLQNESIGSCELAISMRNDNNLKGDCSYCIDKAKAEAEQKLKEMRGVE